MEMSSKNVFGFIVVLVILLLIAVGVSRLGDKETQPNNPASEEQNFEELNWERYENSEVEFAISHPFEMDVENVQGGPAAIGETVNFSLWGPTQAEATEFFDGISVTIQKESMEDLGASANIENYAGLSHEADGNQPITDDITPIREIDVNGMTGYTYTVTSIGVSNHIFLDHEEENMVLHIIYTAPDPTNQGFQQTVNQMLDTLVLI